MLGSFLLSHIALCGIGRSEQPETSRRDFFVYLDEPRVLADIPVPLDGLFERARSLGVGLTIATQSLSTLPSATRQAALTNAATLIAWRQTADDAELLARHLPGVSADALQGLGAFEVIARVGLGPGDVSSPVSGRTVPLPAASSDPNAVRRASAERYGSDPAEVDQALAKRHDHSNAAADEAPVGRKRRQS